MSILVSGSLAHDYIMDFPDRFRNHILPDKLHILNVCFVAKDLRRTWGGTAGNIAYSLNLLQGHPVIVSGMGKDGGEYLAHLRRTGISTRHIGIDPVRLTASAFITTDLDDNQVIAFYGGLPSRTVSPINKAGKKFSFAIIAPTDAKVMQAHARQCAALGIPFVFDPGQQVYALSGAALRRMIRLSDLLIGNDYEMKIISKRTGWSERELARYAGTLVTTLGARGSRIETRAGERWTVKSAKPRRFLDPTGAGDAYRGGFLKGLEKGYDFRTCAELGSVSASFAIEAHGTQEHRFTPQAFLARYRKTYNKTATL